MKTLFTSIILLLTATHSGYADAWKDTLRGGLIGAAGGALISELSDSDDARYTIPLFTTLGALTGYTIHESRHGRHNRYGYYLPYLALPYAWYDYRPSATRYYRHSTQPAATPKPSISRKSINRHPGISLTTIPITLKNGTVIPIHLFKTGDHYTGPQGETYKSRPDAATLQQRYCP